MIHETQHTVAIVGGSGYTGGELLRLLHLHPYVTVTQITSRNHVGQYVHTVHPHMRGNTQLKFTHPDTLKASDVLFLALPHGVSAQYIEHYSQLANYIIDLSADFRLAANAYEEWYETAHPNPTWLDQFVYGLPEVSRERLQNAHFASGVGCNATVTNLALLPLVRAELVEQVFAEIKVGSSEGGQTAGQATHHPVRSGAVRTYRATRHRHHAEVIQVLGNDAEIRFSVTAIEMIRGVHLVAHVQLTEALEEKDIWRLYRTAYRDEPFIRLINARQGLHRLPEPRLVAGTNYCDIGFELDTDGRHLVVIAALDNLGKGASGSAIQAMNIMLGIKEETALQSMAIYP